MTAVVVGGASGIGRAVAASYRAAGRDVLVWDIAEPHDVACDLSDPVSVQDAVARTLDRIGVPDQLTITAGIGHSGLLTDETVAAWDRVMAVNARGPGLVMRGVARAMLDAGSPGSIVATSSVSAHLVDRAMGLYCASKAALSMIVQVAAAEWGAQGIRVNAVAPGVTQTPMLGRAPTDSGWLRAVAERTTLGRLGQPDDIAAAVLALHELPWVTGQVLDCDGGLSLHSPIDAFGETQRGRG
jgi:NAD(P)-dependent dehydrogenase (short-subunit alcohol dehydrogenase family)